MSIASEVGKRIRFYRKMKHLSQEQLAELCNFHPTYIGQLERGEKNASLESVFKISCGLEIPITQFLEDIDTLEHSSNDNIPLEIYHLCLQLSENKQKALKKLLDDMLEFLEQ